MRDTQDYRGDGKDYHKDGSDKHRATWKGTGFKWIQQRGNLFKVRRYVKKGNAWRYYKSKVFRSLADAQDFLSSLDVGLVEETAENEKA